MKIAIPLDEKGMLPDRFGKYSSPELRRDGNNICSFPIEVSGVPEGAKSLALSFVDYDSHSRMWLCLDSLGCMRSEP